MTATSYRKLAGRPVAKLPSTSPSPTLGEWVDVAWWPTVEPHLGASTQTHYRSMLDRHLLPAFGNQQLASIDRTSINEWFEHHSLTTPMTANNSLQMLRRIFEHARKSEAVLVNPAKRIRLNPNMKRFRILNTDERERLIAALHDSPPQHRVKARVLEMLLYTGCRSAEIRTLRWEYVEDDRLELPAGKTGRRRVWLGSEAMSVFKEARRMNEEREWSSEFVFPSPTDSGRYISHPILFRFWSIIRRRLGLNEMRIHDLRHNFASEAVRQGISLPVVARLLGHTDLTKTMRYVHATNSDAMSAVDRVGNRIEALLQGKG